MGRAALSGTHTLRALMAIQALSMGAMDMSGPFWPAHLRALGHLSPAATARVAALAYALPLTFAMVSAPIWGRLADRRGHKPMVLRALAALSATQAWIAFSDDVVAVLVARAAQGALGGFIAAAQGYALRLTSRSTSTPGPDAGARESGAVIAKLQSAAAAGAIVGPALGGWLVGCAGFRSLNVLASLICAACAVLAWWALPAIAPGLPTEATTEAPGCDPVRERAVGLGAGLLFGVFFTQAAEGLPQSFVGLYSERVLALLPGAIGLCQGALAFGSCFGAFAWAGAGSRASAPAMLAQASGLAGICAVMALVLAPGVSLPVIVASHAVWGLALGALLPILPALLARAAPAGREGDVAAKVQSATKGGALAGTLTGGIALATLPLASLMWLVAAGYVGGAAVLLGVRHRLSRSSPPSSRARGHS